MFVVNSLLILLKLIDSISASILSVLNQKAQLRNTKINFLTKLLNRHFASWKNMTKSHHNTHIHTYWLFSSVVKCLRRVLIGDTEVALYVFSSRQNLVRRKRCFLETDFSLYSLRKYHSLTSSLLSAFIPAILIFRIIGKKKLQ